MVRILAPNGNLHNKGSQPWRYGFRNQDREVNTGLHDSQDIRLAPTCALHVAFAADLPSRRTAPRSSQRPVHTTTNVDFSAIFINHALQSRPSPVSIVFVTGAQNAVGQGPWRLFQRPSVDGERRACT